MPNWDALKTIGARADAADHGEWEDLVTEAGNLDPETAALATEMLAPLEPTDGPGDDDE